MEKTKVIVGLGSCGIAAGAGKVYERIRVLKETGQLDFELKKTSCIGMCYREPLVEVIDETGSYLYGEINEVKAAEIIDRHVNQHNPIR
jgi:NADH-quinone oxidoreductase subunit F